MPQNCIAYIDGYGNLKTTIQHESLKARDSDTIRVHIGNTEQQVIASDRRFAVEPGQLAFAPVALVLLVPIWWLRVRCASR